MMCVSHRRQHLAVMAGFALITLVQTWPLAAQLSRTLPNDLGDPILNTWILSWNAQTLPLTRAWWDAPMFYPARGVMALSETLLGLSILASPLQWLGASPVAAYNVLFLLSFPLSAFTAYLLAWSLTRRAGPSIVAGAIYGYAAFRWLHLGHLQILWSWWMPLALLGLHRWTTDRRKAGLLLFGAAWLGESLSNGYYFFYFSTIVCLWLAWFTPWRQARRTLAPVLLTWAAAIALMTPLLLTYVQVQREYHFHRSSEEIARRGADGVDFFRPASVSRLPHADRPHRGEAEVWLGLVAACALAAGIIVECRGGLRRAWRERSASAFYLGATLVAMALALGPTLRVAGLEVGHHGPYAWLMAIVPGFDGLRVPARFTLVAMLCLATATALLLARVRLANAARERLLFGGIVAIALLETWPGSMSLLPLPPVLDPRVLTPASAVIELPFGGEQEMPALYRSMFHRRPLVNGYSGYFPSSYQALADCLAPEQTSEQTRDQTEERTREQTREAGCLTPVRRAAGALDVVIDRQHDPIGIWQQLVSDWPDAQLRFRNHQFAVIHFPLLPDAARRDAPTPIGAPPVR